MFIKRTQRILRGKTHSNHLVVESVATESGPRHRVVCSLGSLGPASKAQWLKLAHHLQDSLGGQESFLEHSVQEQAWVQKATLTAKGKKKPNAGKELRIDLEKVEVEEPGKPEQSMSAIRSGSGWAWTNSLLRLASVTRPAC